jgi:hypothetical protein
MVISPLYGEDGVCGFYSRHFRCHDNRHISTVPPTLGIKIFIAADSPKLPHSGAVNEINTQLRLPSIKLGKMIVVSKKKKKKKKVRAGRNYGMK